MVVLLYKSGIPVNLTNDFNDLRFDIEGFLIEFTKKTIIGKDVVTTKYAFHNKKEFKTSDKKRSDLIDGYYNEDQFLNYIESVGFNIVSASDMIYKHKFNFDKFIAKENDPISVRVTNFGAPYDLFYDRKKYDFLIESLSDEKGIRSYSDGILDGFDIVDYKLKLPSTYSSSNVPIQNQVNTAGYHFYTKNLGRFIYQYSSDEEKRKFKKITLLIIFKIREIVNEIFPNLLLNVTTEKTLNDVANSINTDLNNLSNFEKILFILKKSWGYYYDSSSALPHRKTLPSTFNENSTYSDFEYYYLGLVSFYDEFYKIPQTLAKAPEFDKYRFVLTILPINALSLIPFEITKSIIESFIKKKYLAEYQKRFLTRLIVSIPFSLADSFLDYLGECNNGVDTNYQAIYYILGDARTKRYIPFIDETLTRRQYVFATHQLWTASKYNFYHIPNGVTPILDNINPNAYFIQNYDEYIINSTLVFNTGYYFSEEGITKQGFEYSAGFIHDKIRIFKTEKTEIYKNEYIDDGYGAPAVKSQVLFKLPEKLGDFHMYHPISLIGIQPDLEVILPEASFYPAFIFQYVEEFEDLKEFDASVNLGIAITIELALAYFTGGLSSLRYLNYLKNASRIYQALTNSALASEQILIWSALEGATNALAISGSILYSYNNYLIQLSNDPSEIEKLEKLNRILFWLILAQATASVTFRYKAINAADEFLDSIPPGAIHPDVENLLITLRNQKATNILGIRQKLIDLGLEDSTILTKFDDFAADVKIAFWNDFKRLSKEEWKLVNKSNTLENWKLLYDRKIIDRADLTVITSSLKMDAITKYYPHIPLRKILESAERTKRWLFLNRFGNDPSIFVKFALNPEKITEFVKANGFRTSLLSEADYLWLENGFSANQLDDIYIHLMQIRNKIKEPNNAYHNKFRDLIKISSQSNKEKAIEYLGAGGKISTGEYIEKPAIDYIKRNLASYEEGYVSVDIQFCDLNNNPLHSRAIRDIDGLIYDIYTAKFEKVKSCKLPVSGTEIGYELDMMLAYKNIPTRNNTLIKNFIMNNKRMKKFDLKAFIDKVENIRFKMIDVKTKKEIIMSASEFQQKLKANYLPSDIIEINPSTFNTTKKEIIEGTYQYLHKKYNQTNSWD
ncbi:hypothetical protein [Flavobacterium sp. LC2016-01]|uniref:hypothetical protein n=1 Tax=Flavobacterium sp. LC2016-01 TaxID=2675876 RepID=UPI0012BAAD3F|nr:hypothetical protein [Flavobacterium sp. LC2016-01]MTH18291.1 hypothetical protein [Flavobacterium sp. LC2016-01]